MVYLDYLLLIIIIVLLYILCMKLHENNYIKGFNYKEGFEHIGSSVVAGKQKDEKSKQNKFKEHFC